MLEFVGMLVAVDVARRQVMITGTKPMKLMKTLKTEWRIKLTEKNRNFIDLIMICDFIGIDQFN